VSVSQEVRNQIMAQAQGAMALYAAFVGLALSHLFEYVQGNHFLHPEEIEAAFH
jgi:hypothetical protein